MSTDETDEDVQKVAGLLGANSIESLTQLIGFLSHRSVRVRNEAAKAASGLAAWGKEGTDALTTAQPDPLPILVSMIGDRHIGCCAWALSALSNLCTEESSERIVKEGAVVRTMDRILQETEQNSSQTKPKNEEEDESAVLQNASKLLANLTRLPQGRAAAIGYLSDGTSDARAKQITAMCARFTASRALARDPLRSLALFFENIAMEAGGARVLCDEEAGFLLGAIAKDLALATCQGGGGDGGEDDERLMGAAGTVKNCCFQK
jgi:hypothetical protein